MATRYAGEPLERQLARLVQTRMNPEAVNVSDPARAARAAAARGDLEEFAKYTKPSYKVNWHHRTFFQYLAAWIAGTIKRLMIFSPPQHGKSEIVSRILPSYLLGKFPDDQVMACSYAGDLASDMNRDVQGIIDSDRYREVFPGTTLWAKASSKSNRRYVRTSKKLDIVGRQGSYRCAGVKGGITGKPFNWGIIDDPYKDDQEANSPAIRDAVWNWYTTTFSARKTESDARILITLTRWHQLDLAGQLLDLAKADRDADQWTVVLFPAILETEEQRTADDPRAVGEALWPERHSLKELLAARSQMPQVKWSALYQQRPTPSGGAVFKREHFRYFHTERVGDRLLLHLFDAPDGEACQPRTFDAAECSFFQTIDAGDTKSASSSYTCVMTFCRTPGGDLLVYHVWRAKLEFPKRYKAIIALRSGLGIWRADREEFDEALPVAPWPRGIAYQAIETKASGISILQQGAADGTPFLPLNTGAQSKVQRAASATVLYENHKLFHHRGQPWLLDFEAEELDFPSGKNNDQGDCLAYGGIQATLSTVLAGPAYGGAPLIAGRDVPATKDGSASIAGTSLEWVYGREERLPPGTYDIGGQIVRFDDDD